MGGDEISGSEPEKVLTANLSLTGLDHISGSPLEGSDEELPFYSDFFSRLPDICSGRCRLIRYQSENRGTFRTFIGLTTPSDAPLPAGMTRWELSDTQWCCQRQEKETRDIRWQWLCKEAHLGDLIFSSGEIYRITAFAQIDPGMQSADRDQVRIEAYDPSWPARYASFISSFSRAVGPDLLLRAEHYGSTAVIGMPAKPVIDILIQIPSFEVARERVFPLLQDECWEYWWYGAHMVFIIRKTFMGERAVHLHLAPEGHPIWNGIRFRDYLIAHPDTAAAYARLKRDLAETYRDDRERYTRAKGEFIRDVYRRITPSSTR